MNSNPVGGMVCSIWLLLLYLLVPSRSGQWGCLGQGLWTLAPSLQDASIISALGYAGSRLCRALVLDIAGTGHGCHLAFSVGRGGRCVLEKEPLITAQILPAEPLWRNQLSFKLGSTLPPPVSQPCSLGTQSILRCGP